MLRETRYRRVHHPNPVLQIKQDFKKVSDLCTIPLAPMDAADMVGQVGGKA